MDLPPIVQHLIGETSDFITSMTSAREALKSLKNPSDQAEVSLGILREAFTAMEQEAKRLSAVSFSFPKKLIADVKEASGALQGLMSDLKGTRAATTGELGVIHSLMTTGGTTGATPAQLSVLRQLTGVSGMAQRMGLASISPMIAGMSRAAIPTNPIDLGMTTAATKDQVAAINMLLGTGAAGGGGGGLGNGKITGGDPFSRRFKEFMDSGIGSFASPFLAFHQITRAMHEAIASGVELFTAEKKATVSLVQGFGSALQSTEAALFDGFHEAVGGFFSGLNTAMRGLLSGDIVGGSLSGFGTILSRSVGGFGKAITGTLVGATQSLSSLISGLGTFGGAQTAATAGLIGSGVSATGAIGGFAVGGPAGLAVMVGSSIIGGAISGIGKIAGQMKELAAQVAAGIASAMGGIISQVIGQVASSISDAIAGFMGTAADLASGLVKRGMEVERLQTTFGSLVGDVAKGKTLFADIQGMAIVRPYTVDTLADAADQLLSMNIAGDKVTDTLARLGDIALGDDPKLKKLVALMADVAEGGRLTTFRLREFAKVGVTVSDFAKTMGISVSDFQAKLSKGMVGGDVVVKTLNRLTEEGGRFFDSNQKLMETSYGQWHRLSAIIDVVSQRMGTAFTSSLGLANGLKSIGDFVKANADSFVEFASQAGKFLGEMAIEAVNVGKAMATMFTGAGGMGGFQMPSATGIVDFFVDIFGKAAVAVASFIDAIIDSVGEIKLFIGGLIHEVGGSLLSIVNSQVVPGGFKFTSPAILDTLLGPNAAQKITGQLGELGLAMVAFGNNMKWANQQVGPSSNFAQSVAGTVALFRTMLGQTRVGFGVPGGGMPLILPGGIGGGVIGSGGIGTPIGPFWKPGGGRGGIGVPEILLPPHKKTLLEEFRESFQQVGDAERQMAQKAFVGPGGLRANIIDQKRMNDIEERRGDLMFDLIKRAGVGEAADRLPKAAIQGSAEAMDTISKASESQISILQELLNAFQAAEQDAKERTDALNEIKKALPDLPEKLRDLIQGVK